MVAWFLVAIATVAFFAYIAVVGVTTVDTTGTYAGRADTVRRLDAVADALLSKSSSIQNDGIIYAPAGVPGNGEYLLPEDLQPSGITSFGAKFQYCPMGQALDTANEVVSYPGGSYGIRTSVSNGNRYVVTGRITSPAAVAGDPNVIGFVVAQLNPGSAMPGCGQIVRATNTYTAPNGIVRVLRRTAIADIDATDPQAVTSGMFHPSAAETVSRLDLLRRWPLPSLRIEAMLVVLSRFGLPAAPIRRPVIRSIKPPSRSLPKNKVPPWLLSATEQSQHPWAEQSIFLVTSKSQPWTFKALRYG